VYEKSAALSTVASILPASNKARDDDDDDVFLMWSETVSVINLQTLK